jgi:hypothetical protein
MADTAIHLSYLLVVHIANKGTKKQPRTPMVEIQWQQWQDDLLDGHGSFADGKGIPDGLS